MLRTSSDLARVMNQSDDTARRVLREVFPRRDEPVMWLLDEQKWYRVLHHLAHNKERHFGCRRKRVKQQPEQNIPLMHESW